MPGCFSVIGNTQLHYLNAAYKGNRLVGDSINVLATLRERGRFDYAQGRSAPHDPRCCNPPVSEPALTSNNSERHLRRSFLEPYPVAVRGEGVYDWDGALPGRENRMKGF